MVFPTGTSMNNPKIVAIRLIADDHAGANAALALLNAKLGDSLQNMSDPSAGHKGGVLSYGNLLVSTHLWLEDEKGRRNWSLVDTTTGDVMATICWNDPWYDATISWDHRAENSPQFLHEDSLEDAKRAVERNLKSR
jgi:hypothetical protein